MRTLNRVTLIGDVGERPEVRVLENGHRVCHLRIATNRSDSERTTDWHDVTTWNDLADLVARRVEKGDRLYIDAQLQYEGGITNLIAREVIFFPKDTTL